MVIHLENTLTFIDIFTEYKLMQLEEFCNKLEQLQGRTFDGLLLP
jgi:hypothetical protein